MPPATRILGRDGDPQPPTSEPGAKSHLAVGVAGPKAANRALRRHADGDLARVTANWQGRRGSDHVDGKAVRHW
ncbi:hypothetical protein NE235_15985 [Actinoallomurus spadix]|uniref:hypothetical protein n=1 Tax=Actinoallomurus spadix TaxID=79912 RepID=UPI002092CC79|nr:hypothetical protein [Actinoallomurus spadix]MCO5987601.1 hypothetical protein [Actinoallomurus spadix]